MAKTYAPQMVKMMQRLNVYITKHLSSISPTLNSAQLAAVQSIQAQIAAQFNINERETP